MIVKDVAPFTVFFHSQQANIAELADLTREIPPRLFLEVEKTGSKINGPISFLYYGMDGNPETEFQLEIVLPVDKAGSGQDEFDFKVLDRFKCISTVLEGSWSLLGQSYEKLVNEAIKAGHNLMFESREIYHNITDAEAEKRKRFESPENITEIQMRIQSSPSDIK